MLGPGARIGPYEIVGSLGAGGMGEVSRARDARLARDVALKILPELFASDADRLARFSREAQVLAALTHQNIAAIYGLEADGADATPRALVMALVEIGQPTLHSEFRHFSSRLASRYYDVAADSRLLVIFRTGSETPEQSRQINVVINWFDELRRLVPLPQ